MLDRRVSRCSGYYFGTLELGIAVHSGLPKMDGGAVDFFFAPAFVSLLFCSFYILYTPHSLRAALETLLILNEFFSCINLVVCFMFERSTQDISCGKGEIKWWQSGFKGLGRPQIATKPVDIIIRAVFHWNPDRRAR